MRHYRADIGDIVGLDAQQGDTGAVGGDGVERHAGEAQEAGRITGGAEALDEGLLDQIEIGFDMEVVVLLQRRLRQMRGLPLRGGLGRDAVIMAVGVPMAVSVRMAAGAMVVMMVVSAMHGGVSSACFEAGFRRHLSMTHIVLGTTSS